MVWERKTKEIKSCFSLHCIKNHINITSLLSLTLITWFGSCLSDFCTAELFFNSLFHTVLFWRKALCVGYTATLKVWGDIPHFLRTEYINYLEFFCIGDTYLIPINLSIQFFISICAHIYFSLWIIRQYFLSDFPPPNCGSSGHWELF